MLGTISMLIIEDSLVKRERVVELIRSKMAPVELRVVEADSYEAARAELAAGTFDFVILDIRLPAGHGEPEERWSRVLLGDIVSGALGRPVHVFGLTEHEAVVEVERQYFDSNMFGFALFSWESDDWADLIVNKMRYLVSAIHANASFRLNHFETDVLILTARHDSEFVPIRSELFGSKPSHQHPFWREASHFGTLRDRSGVAYESALICVEAMGLSATAALASQAIQFLRPRLVVMLGMCAGFRGKSLKILDCIMATESTCWQDGKFGDYSAPEKYDQRGKHRNCSSNSGVIIERMEERYKESFLPCLEIAAHSADYRSIRLEFGEDVRDIPIAKSGLMLSGSAIVADDHTRKVIENRHSSALGLEMEVYALFTAAIRAMGKTPNYFAIKGIADFADGKKKDRAQTVASRLSAVVFKAVFEQNAPELCPP